LSFQGADRSYRLFQSQAFDQSILPASRSSERATPAKIPAFLVRRESTLQGVFGSLKTLCTRTRLHSSRGSKYFNGNSNVTRSRIPALGIADSLLLHCALIMGIIYVPMALPTKAPKLSSTFLPPEVIFYPVPEHRPASHLPRITPRGRGGRPGSGTRPEIAPDFGRTKSNVDLTAISKPLHPDNLHQTIVQPASPPELRIPNDLQLPNLALGSLDAPKKPNIDLALKKPAQQNTNLATNMATPAPETKADYSLTTVLQPTNSQPKMPIPAGSIARPMRVDGKLVSEMATPTAETNSDHSLGSSLQGSNSQPKMPLSGGSIARPMRRDGAVDGVAEGTSDAPQIGITGDGRAILAIGIDPSGPNSAIAVPPGSRWGDFSVAPGTGGAGSPGGHASGAPGGGGSAGNGHSGDESVGLGPGHEGGGGGKNGSSAELSIKGSGTSVGGSTALLDPRIEAKMVYPVPMAIGANFRKNRMIVSSGPMGGGGLDVYGALTCGKIYTIFLPMNGASWTMQYCPKTVSVEAPKTETYASVIHLEPGLVPPDPDMESRYDFKRLPMPPGKAQKLIVLKGSLLEDGSIANLEIYQSIVSQMDEAARIAFGRWKFKPAMRAGKPIALDILVGIPPEGGSVSDSK